MKTINTESLYQEIFEVSTAPIVILGANTLITKVNDAFCELSGFDRNELIGESWLSKIPDEEVDRLAVYNELRRSFSDKAPKKYETKLRKKNGELRDCLISASVIAKNKMTVVSIEDITEIKSIEEKLRFSENRFRTIVEYANEIVFSIDNRGKLTYVSPNWTEVLGHDLEEVIGSSFELFVNPADISKMHQIIENVYVSKNKVSGVEYQVKTKDGNWRWHSSSASPVLNKKGEVFLIIGISHDITEKREMEQALLDSEFFFKESQRAANIGSYKADFIAGTWESSEVLNQIFGIDENYDRSINQGWVNIIHPDDRSHMSKYLDNIVVQHRNKFNAEYRIVRKSDGVVRWVNGLGEVICNKNNQVIGLIGTIQDVTQRKNSEQAIHEYQAKLNIALKIAKLGSWEYDVAEDLFYFNDTFFALFKTTVTENGTSEMKPEDYGRKFVFHEDIKLIREEIIKALETKSIDYERQIEHRFIYANGEIGNLVVRFVVIRDENGKIVKFFGINQDITGFKKTEKKLKEMNIMKDKFFSIIAHDLKSPFNSIVGLSEIAVHQVQSKKFENIVEIVSMILKSSQKAMDLVNNLLEWARAETGRMKFAPEIYLLKAQIDNVVDLFKPIASEKSISIHVEVSESIQVKADKSMIGSVLRNLISNAVKFTQTCGEISILAMNENDQVEVIISDNGVGMSENTIEKLFRIDCNFSTIGTNEEEGTGLGLILCKEFIEKHGGQIWATSTKNKGSVFSFSIPHNLENVI